VVTPRYSSVRERAYGLREVARLRSLTLDTGSGPEVYSVKSAFIPGSKVQIYFIENRAVFDNPQSSVETGKPQAWPAYLKQLEFFNNAALQLAQHLNWPPDIIHCNCWHTALTPHLVRNDDQYREWFSASRVALHLEAEDLDHVMRPEDDAAGVDVKRCGKGAARGFKSRWDYIAAGMQSADLLVNISPQTTRVVRLGEGRKPAGVTQPSGRASGSAGGGTAWDPTSDLSLSKTYNSETCVEGKNSNKCTLLRELGRPAAIELPVVAVASSPAASQGSGVFATVGTLLPSLPAFFVFIPSGDPELDRQIKRIVELSPERTSLAPSAGEEFKRLLLAGSDILLMPTPCESLGFTQADTMLYGTVPVVGHVNGRVEAVEEYAPLRERGSGFTFDAGDGGAMLTALCRAISVFRDQDAWQRLRQRAMCADFSWAQSACQLVELYAQATAAAPAAPPAR